MLTKAKEYARRAVVPRVRKIMKVWRGGGVLQKLQTAATPENPKQRSYYNLYLKNPKYYYFFNPVT